MKIRCAIVTAFAVLCVGCANQQTPNSGVPLAAQSTPPPAYSALDQGSIIPAAHQRYSRQRNPLEGAATGAMIGGGMGQVIGGNTESTVYGAAGGALIGYGMYR